jgi:endonuclease YncB( thermonuclease family)
MELSSLFLKLLLFGFFVSFSTPVFRIPDLITGKVIAVTDGDTIEILFAGKPMKVRLGHIDCPELKNHQPFGIAAKQFTSEMCFGQIVTIINQNQYDRYHRLIGVAINNKGINVNKALVVAGLAWHFKKYSADKAYASLEQIAKMQVVGLWRDKNPIPPWKWRHH